MEKTLEESIKELIDIHGKDAVVEAANVGCPPGYISDGKGGCIFDPTKAQ